jgi:dihydrofolate reductase
MGKIISLIHISLDGFMADTNGQINWIRMDGEVHGWVMELRRDAAGTLYGRTTYKMMDTYWPGVLKDPGSYPQWQVDYAEWVDKALKVVVSKTLPGVDWNNTRLIRDNVGEEIRRIKEEVSGDLLLLASATLVGTLLPMGLIDEVAVTVNPIILGKGRPFFVGLGDKVPLRLRENRTFSNGAIGLRYQVTGGVV